MFPRRVAIRTATVLLALLIATVPDSAAAESGVPSPAHVRALDRMMVALAAESAQAGALIRTVYQEHLDLLFLGEYADLEAALETGGVTPLPADPLQFNVAPRLEGLHPIGEKDLPNQNSYLAARPAAVGALLEIAAHVRTGPIEITSLVRHGEYQNALKATNRNAATSVPMHTMGLAFDIGLLNTPLETVYELRDVLREMRDAGDILFVGERRQLVFHVVPHPSRLGHFTEVYTRLMGDPSSTRAIVVTASGGHAARGAGHPTVTAEVVSVMPENSQLHAAWFSALEALRPEPAKRVESPLPAETSPAVAPISPIAGMTIPGAVAARSLLALLAALATAAYRILTFS